MRDEVVAAVVAAVPAVTPDAPLGARTTYRCGGSAAVLTEVGSIDDLVALADALAPFDDVETLIVGNGSNLLVADDGFDGVAVVLVGDMASVTIEGTTVVAGGAVMLPVLARQTAAAGLGGLTWAVGVPGTVGGAVRMNAGGHGSDVARSLREIRRFDLATGHDEVVSAADLDLRYRHSSVAPTQVVVSATFDATPSDAEREQAELSEIVAWRRANQPGGRNAGSVFTNPDGDSAGRLIDEAGLKGFRIGTAEVSERHANFIIADDGGRSSDVVAVMAHVRDTVADRTGIVLEPETRFAGFGPAGERPL